MNTRRLPGAWVATAALLALQLVAGAANIAWAQDKAKLYEAAKKEGELVLWGPPTDTVEKSYREEFQRAFPGIKVKAVGDGQAPQKLLTEALAGTHQVDVFWWPISGFLDLEKRALVAAFDTAQLAAFGIGPGDTALGGRALKAANVIYTLAYDTRRFKPHELPKTWEDLLDPRWRGRIEGATLLMPGVPATLGLSKGEAWALERLYAVYTAVAQTPEMQKFLAEQGLVYLPNPPGQFAARVQAETARWAQIVREHNIKVE